MAKSADSAAQRRKLLGEIARLAEIAIFGTLSETYRTCGQAGCHCQGDGPKHGPHLNVSYRGEKGKTTGYYVPKAAQEATREGVAGWHVPLVAGFGLKPMVGSMQRTSVWLAHCVGCRKHAIRSGSCWAAHIFGPRGFVE